MAGLGIERELENGIMIAVACVTVVCVALIGATAFVAGKLFEYSVWSIAGKDLPFALDVVAGTVSGPVNLMVAVGCCIARACGSEVPFIQ